MFVSTPCMRAAPVRPQMIEFGRYEMDTWYYSPYPEPYASCTKLYLCEYTLKYFRKKKTLLRHLAKLDIRHPPGGGAWAAGQRTWRKGMGGGMCGEGKEGRVV